MNAAQVEIADLYRRAKIAATCREAFGVLPKIDHLPEWLRDNLRDNLGELALAALRAELIETFREAEPEQQWDLHDGDPLHQGGDWINVSHEPERLVEWIDAQVKAEIDNVAADVLRGLLARTTTQGK